MKKMSQSSILPWEPFKGILYGGALFASAHFKASRSIASHFPSCLFPSIIDDTHFIGPLSIVSSAYEHFQIKFHPIGLSIQPLKCVAWSPFGLLSNYNTRSQFTTPSKGIKVLVVLLGTSTLTSSFIKDALLKDVQHVDLLPRMGDVQVAFGILTHYFVQRPSYPLRCILPSSTYIESIISFDFSFLQNFGHLLGPRSFDSPKGPLVCKQVSFLIIFGGIKLLSIVTIAPTTYLRSWALVTAMITIRFIIDQYPFLLEALAHVDNNTSRWHVIFYCR
jgi:hypothetical protein